MLDAMDDDTTHDDETRTGIDAPADDAFTDHFTSPIYDDPAGASMPVRVSSSWVVSSSMASSMPRHESARTSSPTSTVSPSCTSSARRTASLSGTT